ncbi:MAG: hypothetical protein ACKO9A_01645 [Alphaproteobacteria bacterium]
MESEALERAAFAELLKQRRAGRFISAEEMDHRIEEIFKAKLAWLGSRKD